MVTAENLSDSGFVVVLVNSVSGDPMTSRLKQRPDLGSSLSQRNMSLGPSFLDDEISRL